jgi:predicted MFS family arabinose efflux permease
VTIGLVGAIYGSQPLNYQLETLGYEHMLHMIMFIGVLLALFVYTLVPAEKEDVVLSRSVLEDVKNLLKAPNVLMICLLAALMVGPLDGFADVWGTSYLMVSYGFEKSMAASLPSLIFFGMGVGSPLLAVIAEKTGRYYEVIIACAAMMAITFIMLLFGKIQSVTMGTLFFLTGIACAYQILAIYKASTYVHESLVGLTTATVNMIIMAFGYMFHSSIGKVIEATWDGTIVNGIHVYTSKSYTLGLSIIPIALIIGGIGFTLILLKSKKPLN